ncbi:energy transducer TonB [Neptuniibacter pectenicola]|jgi:protein TonB|uniref:energy transducer TonB n=1 Tax=Neptuniibacter pectenicola TaxID=1806669 RepID=UPI000836D80B|nr:energy transducer TonB [Neptuniibacter pectenicola]|tara:strand:+ start:332 stop:1201 length:870 start_codon:yes stop_codon:yes gene_type:complete
MMAKKQVLLCLIVAVFLHIALITPWVLGEESEGAIAEGQDGLLVSVGIAGSFTETAEVRDEIVESSVAEAKNTDKAEVEKDQEQEERVEPEPVVETEPEELVETVQEDTIEPEPIPTPKPKPKPKKEPKKKLKKQPEKSTTTTKTPQPQSESVKDLKAEEADNSATSTPVATKATGVGTRVETGGNPAARQSYLSKVLVRIARVKRYPRSARKDGATGTVVVNFVIQKNGRVKSSRIVTSSGDSRLDEEATAMLLRASPFPSIPAELGEGPLDLTLPIEFSLNPTRKLF